MIAPDKLGHLAAGLVVSLASGVLWAVMALMGLAPLAGGVPAAMFLGGLVAGVTKEGADWLGNRQRPGAHSVEVADVVATAFPGAVILAIDVAVRLA